MINYNKLYCFFTLMLATLTFGVQAQHLRLQALENNPTLIEARQATHNITARNNQVC